MTLNYHRPDDVKSKPRARLHHHLNPRPRSSRVFEIVRKAKLRGLSTIQKPRMNSSTSKAVLPREAALFHARGAPPPLPGLHMWEREHHTKPPRVWGDNSSPVQNRLGYREETAFSRFSLMNFSFYETTGSTREATTSHSLTTNLHHLPQSPLH